MDGADNLSPTPVYVVSDEAGLVSGVEEGVQTEAGAQPLFTARQQVVTLTININEQSVNICVENN